MSNQWLSWLNCVIVAVVICLVIGMGLVWLQRPSEIVCTNPISKQCRLPKNAFTQPPESYKEIGQPLLVLKDTPPNLQLPDLRQQLIYCGKNGRPDRVTTRPMMHFCFQNVRNVVSVAPGDKIYILYEKKGTSPSRYVFSPNNAETSLWIEAQPSDNEVLVKLFMKNEMGEIIHEPEAHAQFKLQEKESMRYTGNTWEIGSWNVDGTLLARQKARWYGPDRFLERHGGEEYKPIVGKQRIDFGENDDVYSIFATPGDCFIWEGKCWKSVQPSEESLKHPLLVAKKIDDRLMTWELWDVDGKGKVILNMLKSTEPWLAQNAQTLQHMFKFVGARTKTQFIFEINKERLLLRPSDWLLMTNKGWKKLETAKEIDDYVSRRLTGTLFVFEGLKRKEDRQVVSGTLINPTRSELQEVELPTSPPKPVATVEKPRKPIEMDLDDDDDDNDDDDDHEELRQEMIPPAARQPIQNTRPTPSVPEPKKK